MTPTLFEYTPSISAGKPNNNDQLADRRTLQLQPLINHLPYSNQQQQHHNPIICLNDQETASIEQLKPVISKMSLLATMMVENPYYSGRDFLHKNIQWH